MVTGDTVNVAARLEQAAAPGQILASERTILGARGFLYAEVDPLHLKGKDKPPGAFERARQPSPEGSARPRPARPWWVVPKSASSCRRSTVG